MMNRLLVCASAALAAAPVALGSITVTTAERQVGAQARAFDMFDLPLNVLSTATSGNFAFTRLANAVDSNDSADALGRAVHDTTLGPNALTGVLSVEARALNDGQPDVSATATHIYQVQFLLAAPTEIRFQGSWDLVETGADANLNFRLFGMAFPAGMPLAVADTEGGGSHDTTLLLAPGPYFVNGSFSATANISGRAGSILALGNYTFSYTVIPAPGAAALLGLGGLLAVRRRR